MLIDKNIAVNDIAAGHENGKNHNTIITPNNTIKIKTMNSKIAPNKDFKV